MIDQVLIEKDAESIKKEMNLQIQNIKQTLDVVQKTLKTYEDTLKDWEKKYSSILHAAMGKQNQQQTQKSETISKGGVLA